MAKLNVTNHRSDPRDFEDKIASAPADDPQLAKLRAQDPEQTMKVVEHSLRSYLRARCPRATESADRSGRGTFTIPSPEHKIVEEIARYVVEALLQSGDSRSWNLTRVGDLRTGDVFVLYIIVAGRQCDEEVTVVSMRKADETRSFVKYRTKKGVYDEQRMPNEYLFYVHRPSSADILAELEA